MVEAIFTNKTSLILSNCIKDIVSALVQNLLVQSESNNTKCYIAIERNFGVFETMI